MTTHDERVEALEQRVEELEATVRGLTEELVDATERVRELEDELDQSPSTTELQEAREGSIVESEEGAGSGDTTKGADGEAQDNEESASDDIIIA
jgi:predicted  nucleic acid-binding Zn-ribbon protein